MNGAVNKSRGYLKLFINGRLLKTQSFNCTMQKEYYLKKWNQAFSGVDTKGMVYIHLFFYCYNHYHADRKKLFEKN